MDIDTIRDEVSNFSQEFFQETSETIDKCVDFINEYDLYVPKENYTIVIGFLNSTLNNFKRMDASFMSSTLEKLSNDVKVLKELLISVKKVRIKELFETKFINTVPSIIALEKEIMTLKGVTQKTTEDIDLINKHMLDLKYLIRVYYDVFSEVIYEDKKYVKESLLEVLNSKTFYYDKVLWIEANNSEVVPIKYVNPQHINILNTKDFLLHTTGLMQPYSQEYKYLQSCLRIYK